MSGVTAGSGTLGIGDGVQAPGRRPVGPAGSGTVGLGRGLVAVGDSITNGEGQPMLGVRCQSWAQWLALALELPYSGLARNGALAAGALAEQVPRLRGPYDLGCVYLGVNDVRVASFDPEAFRACLTGVLDGVRAQASRVLVATIPLDLGRPPPPPARLAAANRVIAELAAAGGGAGGPGGGAGGPGGGAGGPGGAVLLDLADLRGWKLVLPDAVHLTALGQLQVAERAARLLGAPSPRELAEVGTGVRPAARYALTGHSAAMARDGLRRVRESFGRWA